MTRTLLSWSSGKDCAYALHKLRQTPGIEVAGLLTTLNAAVDRVAMHGVRRSLVEAQARAAGLPLITLDLPWPCSNADYERIMSSFVAKAIADGVEAMAFGDLFLEEIRAYREQRLAGTGLKPLFPLWGMPTPALAEEMIASGIRAHLSCIDPKKLTQDFAGRVFGPGFIETLPAGVDPCGENGEFHTFVFAGPMFAAPVPVQRGEVVTRDGFIYCDLVPA